MRALLDATAADASARVSLLGSPGNRRERDCTERSTARSIRERGRAVRAIGARDGAAFRQSQAARDAGADGGRGWSAVTDNYLKVRLDAAAPAQRSGCDVTRRACDVRSSRTYRSSSAICCAADFLRPALDNQLTARRADVPPAALPHRHGDVPIGQDLREAVDALIRRPFERNARRRVQRDQVHLCLDPRQQLHQPARVLRRVVDAVEQHVLERDAAALLERKPAAGVEDRRPADTSGSAARAPCAARRSSRAARRRGSASAARAQAARGPERCRPSTA